MKKIFITKILLIEVWNMEVNTNKMWEKLAKGVQKCYSENSLKE